MKLSNLLVPINLFEIHGNFCCEKMLKAYQNSFTNSSFYAASIIEANMIVLWGSFSKKLSQSLQEPISLGTKKFIVHIKGCQNNLIFINELSINKTINHCNIETEPELLLEAKKCLRA
jgi:hypothetical protein